MPLTKSTKTGVKNTNNLKALQMFIVHKTVKVDH
jgi:hypothetical protein